MASVPPVFSRTFQVAAARAPREDVDAPTTALANRVVSLQTVSAPLAVDGYQAAYERGHIEFFQTFSSGLESLYQQLHAASAEIASLVGAAASPAVAITSLAGLVDYVAKHPSEELASHMRGIRREVDLLSWLCKVRNKAVQHRHENGYTGNRMIVQLDGFAMLRKPLPAPPQVVRKARGMLRGLVRRYSIALDTGTGDVEMITYLDLASYSLFAVSPGEFDRARAVIAEAARHDLIVALPFLDTVDQALAALIGLIPENAQSPFASRAASA